MKVQMINGSPRKDGNTAKALKEKDNPRPAQEPWQPMHFIR